MQAIVIQPAVRDLTAVAQRRMHTQMVSLATDVRCTTAYTQHQPQQPPSQLGEAAGARAQGVVRSSSTPTFASTGSTATGATAAAAAATARTGAVTDTEDDFVVLDATGGGGGGR